MHFLEITEQLCYTEKTQYISALFRKIHIKYKYYFKRRCLGTIQK